MPLFYARWGWVLAFVTLGCAASDPGTRPGIIAHRGVALEAPGEYVAGGPEGDRAGLRHGRD